MSLCPVQTTFFSAITDFSNQIPLLEAVPFAPFVITLSIPWLILHFISPLIIALPFPLYLKYHSKLPRDCSYHVTRCTACVGKPELRETLVRFWTDYNDGKADVGLPIGLQSTKWNQMNTFLTHFTQQLTNIVLHLNTNWTPKCSAMW